MGFTLVLPLILRKHVTIRKYCAVGCKEDIKEIKTCVSPLEFGQASIIQHIGPVASLIAKQQASVVKLGSRSALIEKHWIGASAQM
jgi:hypothetical protein